MAAVAGYNIAFKIGTGSSAKTLAGRTQDDLTIAARTKESLTKDDQGADITTGTATFSEAGTKVIDFGTIVYTKAGTYTYTVNENTPWAGSGWQYDNRPKTVTVTVTEGEDGNLTATVTPVTITNKYNATGSVTFAGTKTIQNKPASMDYDGFVFTIHEVKEGQRPATIGTGKCHANTGNTIVFHTPTIGYTLKDVGTHTYTITEDAVLDGGKPMKPGVSIDSRTYTVTVKVEDNGDGTLKVTTLSGTPGKLDFVNVYAASGSATISASKVTWSTRAAPTPPRSPRPTPSRSPATSPPTA